MPTTLLTTPGALQAVEPRPWAALAHGTPFAPLALAQAYFEAPPPGVSPYVILVTSEEGRPLAVAPWCLQRDRLGLVRLTGIGGADAWFHDPQRAGAQAAGDVAETIASTLVARRRDWDLLGLNVQRDTSAPLIAALARRSRLVERPVFWRQQPVVTLAPTWEAAYAALSKSVRKNHRQCLRRLEALDHRFERVEGQEALDLLAWTYRSQAMRWPERRDWQGYHRYMDLVCRAAMARGDLRADRLFIAGQTAAAQVAVRCGHRAYSLFLAHDSAFDALSPGKLLRLWSMEQLAHEGVQSCDLGPGLDAHKTAVQTATNATVEVCMAGSAAGAAILYAGAWMTTLKQQAVVKRLAGLRPASPLPS